MVSLQQYRSHALPRCIVSGRRAGIDATWQNAPDRAGGWELHGAHAAGTFLEMALFGVRLESSIRTRFGLTRFPLPMSDMRFSIERTDCIDGSSDPDISFIRNDGHVRSNLLLAAAPHGSQTIEPE